MPFEDAPVLHGLLDPNLFNALFNDYGMSIRWYPARKCSCWGQIDQVQVASGAPDPNCPICNGIGRFYQVGYAFNNVVLDGMEDTAIWREDTGVSYGGRIVMYVPYTAKGLYVGGALDDLIMPESISLTIRNTATRGDDTLQEHPVSPVAVTWGLTTYTERIDYTVSGRNIQWISDTVGPPVGARYEATYQFHPWFSIVQGMATARNFANLNLPRSYILELTPSMGEVLTNGPYSRLGTGD